MVTNEDPLGNRDDAADPAAGQPRRAPPAPPVSAPLQAHAEYLQAAVDGMDRNLCLLDETGRILWANAAWHRLVGANGADATGGSEGADCFVWQHVADADRQADTRAVGAALLEVLAGRREHLVAEYQCQTATGPRWFETRARRQQVAGRHRTLVSHEDITARKEVEAGHAAALQQRLARQKFEAVGSLASGVAHDFNNILTAILGNLDLARMQAAPGSAMRELLDEIGKAGERARGLVRQILSFRPGRQQERQLVSLTTLIEEAAGMLGATASKQLHVELRLEPIPQLRLDPSQIRQVLLNLFTNAVHAMPGGAGRLQVELATVELDPAAAAGAGPECRTGRHARIRITDDGGGMAADLLPRMFEPYFSTKPGGKSTGLGLWAAQAIVHHHGGAIAVRSTIGKGTTFDVLLPYDVDPATPART